MVGPQRYTHGPQVHDKALNITNYEENANQSHNEISPRTCWQRWWRRSNPYALLVEM